MAEPELKLFATYSPAHRYLRTLVVYLFHLQKTHKILAEQLQSSSTKRNSNNLLLHNPIKVEIFRNNLVRKPDGSYSNLLRVKLSVLLGQLISLIRIRIFGETTLQFAVNHLVQVFQSSRVLRPTRGGNAQQCQLGPVAPLLRFQMTTGPSERPILVLA